MLNQATLTEDLLVSSLTDKLHTWYVHISREHVVSLKKLKLRVLLPQQHLYSRE